MRRFLILLLLADSISRAQQPVHIRIDAAGERGELKPVWSYFGYDEPNYTYAPNGRKLIRELSELSYAPVHIRTHNLLTSGNGEPALKWGSTNAYREDAAKNPVYDWTIVDRILETIVDAGVKPFVEIGFMPEALSVHSEPYRHSFPRGDLFTGWSYPPKDYRKWSELVYRWADHCAEKFGKAEAASWYWEVWNEPNIGYWHGSPEEYDTLYDYTADAVKRALPKARVGGPATTGPANERAAAFLRQFLEHCSAVGAPLDFVSFHAKGRPQWIDGHAQMGLAQHMQDVSAGFQIVRSFPKFRDLPVILSESDPEGCAACSSPQNAYRNGTLYPVYVAVATKTTLALASRTHSNLEGIVTWAFEFEDRPYFYGYRTLATNGIDKPVLNVFRMLGLMHGRLVDTQSDGAIGVDAILSSGVRNRSDVDLLAAKAEKQLSVLVWNYRDDDVNESPAMIDLSVTGLPRETSRILLNHYRIDETHSNAYTVWKELGSPQKPSAEQFKALDNAGQLQLVESPKWISARGGRVTMNFSLPLQAISLIQLRWE